VLNQKFVLRPLNHLKVASSPFPDDITVDQALTRFLDINAVVSRRLLATLAEYASVETERNEMYAIANLEDRYLQFVVKDQKNLSDVLEVFPSVTAPAK